MTTIPITELKPIVEDYESRFPDGPQPEQNAEVVKRRGQQFLRLINCEVLAVYTLGGQYVKRDEWPALYKH